MSVKRENIQKQLQELLSRTIELIFVAILYSQLWSLTNKIDISIYT